MSENEDTPPDNLNTALNFSLATIAAELALRARKKADIAWENAVNIANAERKKADIAWENAVNIANAERDGLNFLGRFMRSGGERMIKGYSTKTLEDAKKIKEKQENNEHLDGQISSIDDSQTGGRKKKKIRTKKKSKKRTNKKHKKRNKITKTKTVRNKKR